MKLAIADPPYLGRADRWYGKGRGSGRVTNGSGRPARKPDFHRDAAHWDNPASHVALIGQLHAEYDGWALAAHASSVRVLLNAAPTEAALAIWGKPNAMPGGSRVMNSWEPVLFCVPAARRGRNPGLQTRDFLVSPVRPSGFLGSKPPEWTRWVLDMLGYESTDTVDDLFPGSGAVSNWSDGMLPTPSDARGKEKDTP